MFVYNIMHALAGVGSGAVEVLRDRVKGSLVVGALSRDWGGKGMKKRGPTGGSRSMGGVGSNNKIGIDGRHTNPAPFHQLWY